MEADFTLKVLEDVERDGFSVVAVIDVDGDAPTFAYTIGLWSTQRRPELVVAGFPAEVIGDVLYGAAKMVVEGARFESGDRVSEVLRDYEVIVTAVPSHFLNVHMSRAIVLSGDENLIAHQLVWPDRRGFFPGDPRFDARLVGVQELH